MNWKAPVLVGDPEIGITLAVTAGTWAGYPDTITYQWYRDDVPIAGATNSLYEVVSEDGGAVLSVDEIATNSDGTTSFRLTMSSPVSAGALVKFTMASPGADIAFYNDKNTVSDFSQDYPYQSNAVMANRGYRTGKHYLEFHIHNLSYTSMLDSYFVGLASSNLDLSLVSPLTEDWNQDAHAKDKIITVYPGNQGLTPAPGGVLFNGSRLTDNGFSWFYVGDNPSAPEGAILQLAVEFVAGTDDVKIWSRGMKPGGTPSLWNNSAGADPATGTGGVTATISGDLIHPIMRMVASGPTPTYEYRWSAFFREQDMVGPMPSGFSAWSEESSGAAPVNEKARRVIQAMYAAQAPTQTRRDLIDQLYTAIGPTILAKLDRLYVAGAHDRNASRIDWITARKLDDYNGGMVVDFVADRGSMGTGISYDHTFDTRSPELSTLVQQNSAHTAIWSLTDNAHPTASAAAYEFGARHNCIAHAPTSSGGGVRVHVNSNTADNYSDVPFKGYTCWVRDNSANAALYKGGTGGSSALLMKTITRASVALSGSPLAQMHTVSSRDMPGVNRLFAAHRGAALTGTEVSTLYAALRQYAVAIGIDPDA